LARSQAKIKKRSEKRKTLKCLTWGRKKRKGDGKLVGGLHKGGRVPGLFNLPQKSLESRGEKGIRGQKNTRGLVFMGKKLGETLHL